MADTLRLPRVKALRLPRVKICGMTRAEDVAAACSAGADAVGFVHYEPSPRSVALAQAARLGARVPEGVLVVAVLVDPTPAAALAFARACGAGAVQLCGAERADDWAEFPLPILRRLAVDDSADAELERWQAIAAGFVADHPGGPGGTGRTVDAARARALFERAPCLLAGGLDAGNVAGLVRALRPDGVDVSSRLECAPGVKDPELVRAFVASARAAFEELST